MNERRASLVLALLLAAGPAAGEPLTLRKAVEAALARSPEVAAARSALEEGVAGSRELSSPLRPHLEATTTPGYSTGLPVGVAGEIPSLAGVRFRMTLLDTGLKAESLGSEGREAVLGASVAATRAAVVRRTSAAYARLAAAEKIVAAARRRLAAQGTVEKRVVALYREGRRTELDFERAALETARARRSLLAAESDRDLAAEELRLLAGLSAGAPVFLADDPLAALPEPDGSDAARAALTSDPSLLGLARDAELLSRAARFEDRWFRPMVVVDARYSYVPPGFDYARYYLNFSSSVAAAGVSVVVPILAGGRDTARGARSRAQAARLEAERRTREEELLLEVRRAEAALGPASLDLSLARRSQGVAEEALRVAQVFEREERGEADGVAKAELALSLSEEETARAEEAVVRARLRLLSVRGDLAAWGKPTETPR